MTTSPSLDTGGGAVVQAHPTAVALPFGLGQSLVSQGQQCLGRITVVEWRKANVGHRRDVTGTGGLQAEQGAFKVLCQLQVLHLLGSILLVGFR